MKFKRFLDNILGQKTKIKALRYFVVKQNEISIRELSRAIGVTEPNLSIILKELEKNGVLVSKKIGTSLVFSLNYGHYLVDDIILPLFQNENKSLLVLGKYLTKKISFQYVSLILFGSLARGDEHIKSDIDILIIVPDDAVVDEIENVVFSLNPDFIKKFGNSLSPLILKQKEFKSRFIKNDALIRDIAKNSKLLAGKTISEIL